MSVPLPSTSEVNLLAPDAEEVRVISRAFASAASPPGGLSPTQRLLIEATVPAMTGFPADLDAPPITADEFASAMARRDAAFRSRMVQNMVLLGLVLRPLPASVCTSIASFADALGIEEDMLAVTERFAAGSLGLAAIDFDRAGYTAGWDPAETAASHTAQPLETAWTPAVADPGLAAQWAELETLPDATAKQTLRVRLGGWHRSCCTAGPLSRRELCRPRPGRG